MVKWFGFRLKWGCVVDKGGQVSRLELRCFESGYEDS